MIKHLDLSKYISAKHRHAEEDKGEWLRNILETFRETLENNVVSGASNLFSAFVGWFVKQISGKLFATIEVVDGDPAFYWVEEWIIANSKKGGGSYSKRLKGTTSGKNFTLSAPTGTTYHWFKGRPLIITRASSVTSDEDYDVVGREVIRLSMFLARPETLVDAIMQMCPDHKEEEQKIVPQPCLYVASGSHLDYYDLLDDRGLHTVALPGKKLDDIVADVKRFFNSRQKYRDRGIPWSRGYMLYGVPGSGKTSLVKVIANEVKKHLVYVDMSAISSRESLQKIMGRVNRGSIVVFEDIDTDAPTREDTGSFARLSLSSLLNILDGLLTREGVAYFMTTNHIENLDPALLRAGRIDYMMEFDYAKAPEIAKFCNIYLNVKEGPPEEHHVKYFEDIEAHYDVTIADIQMVLQILHLEEVDLYEDAARAIKVWLDANWDEFGRYKQAEVEEYGDEEEGW